MTVSQTSPSLLESPAKPGFFKSLVDNMQVGVIVTDAEGYITYLNQTYARFLEVNPVDAVGRHSNQVIKNSRLHAVAKSGVAEINHPHQYKDIGFLVHRIPIKQNGKITAVMGMVLFDRASTLSKLASQLSDMETMVNAYEQELISLRSTRYTIESIMGNSRAITGLKRHAYKAAATDLPVLITGESGTGKELFAQGIHHASRRRLYPFVRINCSAIPRDLLESELFGYEKGAFTGARAKGKPGKFELAGHGTVFLDEIGDLPMEMQPKLLRVLEEKEYERVGGTKLRRAEFRLLAATNRNLEQMLSEGRIREDLFYRLNVIPLRIPPLRQRPNDILPLAYHLLKQITLDSYRVRIAPQAEKVLENYHWPGNVRELSNLLERVTSYLEGDTIHLEDLPFHLRRHRQAVPTENPRPLKEALATAEREAISAALKASGHNKVRAASLLGIHRSLLYKKMNRHGIPIRQ